MSSAPSRRPARRSCRSSARAAATCIDLGRYGFGQDDAAQHADGSSSIRPNASSPAKTRPNFSCNSRTWCVSKRGRRTLKAIRPGHDARPRQELPAYASGADHRRRSPGSGAFDLLQAMNTGHDGSMGTLHANTPREALSRLESMITMGGFSLPAEDHPRNHCRRRRRRHPSRSVCATVHVASPKSPRCWVSKAIRSLPKTCCSTKSRAKIRTDGSTAATKALASAVRASGNALAISASKRSSRKRSTKRRQA